jgi:hypothetical protein
MRRAVDNSGSRLADDLVQDWLFLVLRYALSRRRQDRQAVLELADRMDSLGAEASRDTFRFFRDASARLCDAVVAADEPRHRQTILAHGRRIDEARLRRAFLLACGLDPKETKRTAAVPRKVSSRDALWKGL